MIQLTLNSIKNIAGNDRLFRNGFMIHQREQITSITASSKNGFKVVTTDAASNVEETSLYFYKDTGTFKYAKCTCHDTLPCKHTIGALLYILYKKDDLSLDLKNNQTLKMLESFEDVLISRTDHQRKQFLSLEVTIHPNDVFSQSKNTYVTLRIGQSQLYMVKNIESFVSAYIKSKKYELSKTLTYNSTYHILDEVDQKILYLLYDFYQTRAHMSPSLQSHVLTPTKAANIFLPNTYVKRLLDLLQGKSYNIDYDAFVFRHQLLLDHVEVDFYLIKFERQYNIAVNTYDIFFPLADDFSYVFYNNQISQLNPKSAQAFKLFYHYFNEKHIDIPSDQLDDFISRVLPVLELIGYITIETSIKDAIVTFPLTSNIYIDKLDEGIALRLSFIYGNYTIHQYPEEDAETDGKILTRQLDKERQITDLIHSTKTEILEDGRLYYATEDDLFYFIDKILPPLMTLSEVFYSKDFKHTYLKSKKELSTFIRYNENSNLLDLDFKLEGVNGDELRELFSAIVEKKHYFKLSDGSFFAIEDSLSNQMDHLTSKFDLNLDDSSKPILETMGFNAFYLDNLLGLSDINVTYEANYEKLLDAIKNPDTTDFIVPASLDGTLRDYQKKGYKWLRALSSFGLGGILADDMGLGKTIQAITLMISSTLNKPSLVVAPTSLLYNWEEEVHKFAPEKKTRVIAGTKQERESLIAHIDDDDIVITSYGALKRDLAYYIKPFDFCIIDEAQHIKNPRSLNARAVKQINSSHRFALTGTPIENTLTELWSIFDFILPNYLGSHGHFVSTYERPIIKENDPSVLEQLSFMIRPFILRRLKEDVLTELPPKIETKIKVELNKHQKKLYMAYVDQVKNELSGYDHMPSGQRSMKILSVLMRLRQICCHPALFMDNYTHDSSKMALLQELLADSIEGGHKILLFSQFTSMLGMIRSDLEKHNIAHYYLDGSIPPIKRQQMVHDFNTGTTQVFLISLKAGGTGLNLTGADVVIHYDPWWNPAVENQATDRAYRIGQKKVVQVYKLITAGTIEEKIFELQQRKMGLIENVIKPGETFINKLSTNELEQLFDA